jgi:GNAT superfamily N-acetyltransferase
MFTLEPTDIDKLEHPHARIIEPGGDILFVEAEGFGIVGARQFELTKMGVLDSARGRKAGAFLLRAILQRAAALDAGLLDLLTNSACAAATHLYEKVGFLHDADIMRQFGARYRRCDVAMRYGAALTAGTPIPV